MQVQPPIDTGKDILFLLTGIWDDADGGPWLCADCCTMEGALRLNPHWGDAITVVRVEAARPRPEIVALLDEDNQNAPTLILADDSEAHVETEMVSGRRILTDPKAICRQLAASHGGARPK
ncbi:DUF3088 domain-containing protein [Maricaulis sp. CAU 1757]